MTRIKMICLLFSALLAAPALAQDKLVRFFDDSPDALQHFIAGAGGTLELVSAEGKLYKWTGGRANAKIRDKNVAYVQRNRTIHLFKNPSLEKNRKEILKEKGRLGANGPAYKDNPDFGSPAIQASGSDPLLKQCWGHSKINTAAGWQNLPQGKDIVVAVTDTGVDYTHPDLIHNMWRNPGETAGDGIDNDGNGFVDDIVGWDFATNDNKPYDLSMSLMDIVLSGGNPGHGTHVAGVIASRMNNSIGTAGVAPQAKLMALRFITEKGQGTDEAAIKAIDYAVANGAQIINASWGGESGEEDDAALREAIERAQTKGVLFVAAAGNGRANASGTAAEGFDNDTDAHPMVPASLSVDNIVAVAAVDSTEALAQFSNWGHKSVDVGAPGVKILSTVPGNRYQDTILDFGSMKVTWDGTSMAAPYVAGSLAAIWSTKPSLTASEVRDILLKNVTATSPLSGKVSSGGRIDLSQIR